MAIINFISRKIIFLIPIFLLFSCKEAEPVPTKAKMQGVWEVVEAYDEENKSIINDVNFLIPTYIQLDDKNSVNTTAGPMFMYLVYGGSNFIKITKKLDAAFQYSNLSLTEGEFFMSNNAYEERFTIEMKLKFPTMETINTILDLMGITPPNLFEEVIYHRFMDVYVSIPEDDENTMIWEFDNTTMTNYNIKDKYGNYVPWTLVNVPFSKARFVLQKRSESIVDLVKTATSPTKK